MDSARTVAVVVPSPAMSLVLLATSRTICAPMFSYGSSSSISFATVTPSLVIVGEPNFLSRTTLRPFGPSVTLTARLSFSIPRNNDLRASSSNNNCFAAMVTHSFCVFALFNHAENVVLAHDQVILAIHLDLRAAILADQHAITLLDFKRYELAVLIPLPRADRNDLAFLRLLLGGIRDDDPAFLHFRVFDRLHQHPIAQRFYVHGSSDSFGFLFVLCILVAQASLPATNKSHPQSRRLAPPSQKLTSSCRRPPSRNRRPRRRLPCRRVSSPPRRRPAAVQRWHRAQRQSSRAPSRRCPTK